MTSLPVICAGSALQHMGVNGCKPGGHGCKPCRRRQVVCSCTTLCLCAQSRTPCRLIPHACWCTAPRPPGLRAVAQQLPGSRGALRQRLAAHQGVAAVWCDLACRMDMENAMAP